MRSQTTSSSSSKQLNLTTVIDFNRNRSNESTEPVDNMKNDNNNKNQFSSSASSCSGFSAHSAEGRCVPISPKKMPATPPRDAGSPASSYNNNNNNHHHQAGAYGAPGPYQQSFLSCAPPVFPSMMMSSSWRTKDEAQASVFRSPPTLSRSGCGGGGGGGNAFFSIQRCNAFDEDDIDNEYDEDEVFCYSDDEEDDDDDDMVAEI